MSLDIWLLGEERQVRCVCPTCDHEHMRETQKEYYSANVTHNLGRMAEEAGIYEVLWRGPENGIEIAKQLIEPLEEGIAKMKVDPQHFRQFSAKNGWGMYEDFVPWAEKLLEACKEWPDAEVVIWR